MPQAMLKETVKKKGIGHRSCLPRDFSIVRVRDTVTSISNKARHTNRLLHS